MTHSAAASASDILWLGVGFVGQTLFFMRFFVQWMASERARRSVIPQAFWYFSLAGGLVLLAYAIRRADPVFIIGQATGLLIYGRNLYFIAGRSQSDGKTAG
ncbi:lipid-A-disaccharide synthase N-terminal domain-containing protein [Hyphomicrobium sp. CS1GBMeth3]|uniref:lipid-A-disaccharide synthase N-terminal domain-containing protein n=1 Tax=Hyphomicrobium sp. CS1GBMeth3 TaxID=1892845 RepID=UPI000931C7AD|nr:lipid-A-disaccharide synthase N-terminal domain-containing protein [Hyphomicrobium sp. CS1GBMeth3]